MSFARVIGQEIPKRILEQVLEKDRLANTYLFYGPPGVGKFLMAWELAKTLLCENRVERLEACGNCSSCLKVSILSHPDLYLVFPHPAPAKQKEAQKYKEVQEYEESFRQTKIGEPYQIVEYSKPANISVDKIRFLKEQIYRKPFQAEKKVVIIQQAESMRIDSSNLLLKIFEEPPGDTLICLTTSQIDRMLPTVISRSQKIRFAPFRFEVIQAELQKRYSLEAEKAGSYASLSEGSLGIALNFASGKWEKTLELSYLLWQSIWDRKTKEVQEIIELFNIEKDRSQILLLIRLWQYLLRDIYVTAEGVDQRFLISGSRLKYASASQRKLNPSRIHLAYQILNQARLDFFRNISIKSILVWLSLRLPEILSADQEGN